MKRLLGTSESDPLVLAQLLYLKSPEEYVRMTKGAIDNRKISEVHRLIAKLSSSCRTMLLALPCTSH